MSNYYYHEHGAYGPVSEMDEETAWTMIVPTNFYSYEMWECIENCADEVRYQLAQHFGYGTHTFNNNDVCDDCHLTKSELGIDLAPVNEYDNEEYQMEMSE